MSLGVTPQQIQDALISAYGNRQVSLIYQPANEYQVILEVEPRVPAHARRAVEALYIRSHRGSLVPLDSVVNINAHDWGR